ncbi:hypothetical protein LQU92_06820 [Kocuria sp. LUK]|uniref:hypothetical protein n=1 Tax=Kocuria sp. LUK TaxID=2897828 RepID=UPI001E59B6AD|nr:hypothetical protein [Kocuria sp. LUK]MCD1144954.1 hypothetical protein [Kocuria sp. LUK]
MQNNLKSSVQTTVLFALVIVLSLFSSIDNYIGAGISVILLATLYIGVTLYKISELNPRAGLVEIADLILCFLLVTMSLVLLAAIADIHNTKLMRLRYTGYLGIDEYAGAYSLWCISIIFALLATRLTFPFRHPPRFLESHHNARSISTWSASSAVILAIMGFVGVSTISFSEQQETFLTRGQGSGNGLQALFYWASAVYVAYVVTAWKREAGRFFPALAAVYTALLFLSANRSPIALILIAILIRIVADKRYGILKSGALLAPLIFLVFSYQSTWRGLLARGAPAAPTDVLLAVTRDPLNAIQRVGFDSIDGMVLAQSLLDKGFSPQYFDPLLSVLNFVPRQIWENKPVLLGSTIGQDFLGLTAGGIFVSGPGYFSLVSGSVLGGIVLFVFAMFIAKLLISYFAFDAILCCSVLYFVARFPLAGDAFDIFLSIQIYVIYLVAKAPSTYLRASRPSYLHDLKH